MRSADMIGVIGSSSFRPAKAINGPVLPHSLQFIARLFPHRQCAPSPRSSRGEGWGEGQPHGKSVRMERFPSYGSHQQANQDRHTHHPCGCPSPRPSPRKNGEREWTVVAARSVRSPSPARSGASLGGEKLGVGISAKAGRGGPPPQPSPTRGEGAHRRCGENLRRQRLTACTTPGPANPRAWRIRPSARRTSGCSGSSPSAESSA
ncbi:hypothetical protein ACVILH_000507 [Bradyrhizobium sp. USDA 4353]